MLFGEAEKQVLNGSNVEIYVWTHVLISMSSLTLGNNMLDTSLLESPGMTFRIHITSSYATLNIDRINRINRTITGIYFLCHYAANSTSLPVTQTTATHMKETTVSFLRVVCMYNRLSLHTSRTSDEHSYEGSWTLIFVSSFLAARSFAASCLEAAFTFLCRFRRPLPRFGPLITTDSTIRCFLRAVCSARCFSRFLSRFRRVMKDALRSAP